jgi:two-component system, NtrC family, sensor kinase
VKPGLRLQIVLLLGGLLLCAFVPLFYAVATYTQVALRQVRHEHARQLGRAIAGHVSEALGQRSQEEIESLLNAQAGVGGVEALGVFSDNGRVLASAGNPSLIERLGRRFVPKEEALLEVQAEHGIALAVVVPDRSSAVAVVLRIDEQSARAAPLVRLVGLYTGVVALATLVVAYFALTRLIVRPLDALTRAAGRVAEGGRTLQVPTGGARELVELGQSLRTMTERLLAEEQALRRKIDEVERATERLKAAQDTLVRSERLASVGRLAAGLAHEVGNPLAALMGLQDLLLESGLSPEEQRDFLRRMRKETERIHRIVRDLLQFARPTAPGQGQQHQPGDVALAVEETATLLKPQKTLNDVELLVELDNTLPRVALQTSEIVQIVLNLVLNAADACGPGGKVRLSATTAPGGVRLVVQDDGPGVSSKILDSLFEPFVTTKEVGKGTGLGLAVCRGLVESVGGTIALDASYTAGARFVVELPSDPHHR